MPEPRPDSEETCGLLERAGQGDARAVNELLGRHRPELLKFVDFHIDPRLRGRIDPSDVVQETQAELSKRMDDFLSKRPMPFRLWLRKKAYERLLNTQRDVLRLKRTALCEVPWPDDSSLLLARPLLRQASPSRQAEAREQIERVSRAVAKLAEADREILLLRHAEDLPFDEIACLLDIQPAAARKRFGRALIRLQKVLTDEGLLESHP